MMANKKLLWILLAGLLIRLAVAFYFYGTQDVCAWEIFSRFWQEGKSPYGCMTPYGWYGYTPIWFWIISIMRHLSQSLNIPLVFAIKLPLILTDVFIFLVLIAACRKMKASGAKTAMVSGSFFLNPVSIMVPAYHGQFGNIAILFLLLAWYIYTFYTDAKYVLIAVYFGISVAVKHFTSMLMPIFTLSFGKISKQIVFILIIVLIFAITIMPYLVHEKQQILYDIFKQNPQAGHWGWSGVLYHSMLYLFKFNIMEQGWFGYLYYFNLFLYLGIIMASFPLIKKYDLTDSIVIVFLIFYCFSTEMSQQYSVWIIPFAALKRGKHFYRYSIICAIQLVLFFLAEHHWRLGVPFSDEILNLIQKAFVLFKHLTWIVCVVWLWSELKITNFIKCKLRYLKI